MDIWYQEAKDNVLPECIFVLVGTKNDLPREVDYEEGINFMKQNNLNIFYETSSKTGDNIDRTFETTAKELLARSVELKTLKEKVEQEKQVQLNSTANKQAKGCC